jgi:hypothetical protein
VHLLDPLSKAWYKMLWNRHGFTPAPTNYGTWPHRRREETCLLNRVLQYRLMSAGISVVAGLFDQSNAFNSMTWIALENPSCKHFNWSDKPFTSTSPSS